MKTFNVELPANLKIVVQVDAETKEEAIDKAINECDLQLHPKSPLGYDIEEWQVFDELIRGNVWFGIIHSANAEEEIF